MELTLKRIFELETITTSKTDRWLDLEVFGDRFGVDYYNIDNEKARERILTENKMIYNGRDCRGRTLEIVIYNGIPCLMYQNNGKGGTFVNVRCLSSESLKECISFLHSLSLSLDDEDFKEISPEDVIKVDAYGMDLKIVDNQLIPFSS